MSKNSENISLGIQLTQARLRAGYTQLEIARLTGTSRSTYCHIESGISAPSVHLLLQLCILYKENPITYLLCLMPEEQLITQKHYTQYLQDLSRIKYKADSKRSRRRSKSHCWSKN